MNGLRWGGWRWLAGLLVGVLACAPARAMIALSATRLVFDGRQSEIALMAQNQGSQPVLLQAWLSSALDPSAPVPFALTPPLAQLAPDGRQALRLFYLGAGLPRDKESLLYLYVLAVPPTVKGGNALQIAVRQRINVFFRPPGLAGNAADSPGTLRWQLNADGRHIELSNPSAYHVALLDVRLGGGLLADSLLLAPGGRHRLEVPAGLAAGSRRLAFVALSDFGGQFPFTALLEPFQQ